MAYSKNKYKIFGLYLDYNINVLALIAFLLSVGSLATQAVQIIRGAQVRMYLGERINLVRYKHPAQPEKPFLVVNARIDYVNEGAVGRDAIISNEYVTIHFGDSIPYEYRWLHFENIIPDKSGAPEFEIKDPAHSELIPGAGSVTHQTSFIGFRDADTFTQGAKAAAVLWVDFLSFVRKDEPMILKFFALDRQGKKYNATCKVRFTNPVLDALEKNHWATALCEDNTSINQTSLTKRAKKGPVPRKPSEGPPSSLK
jgi:hypothetical protein